MQNEVNDDDIIAKCFLQIREGILSQDWQVVLNAYNEMSGEQLELPEKKQSRIDKIREKMGVEQKPAKKGGRKKKDTEPVEENAEPDEEKDDLGVLTTKHQGGKNFAENGFEVVAAAPDDDEIAKNKKLARKKIKIRRSPNEIKAELAKLSAKADDPDRVTGYRDTPRFKPPWS